MRQETADMADAFEKIAQVIRVHDLAGVWSVMRSRDDDYRWEVHLHGVDTFRRAFAGRLGLIRKTAELWSYSVTIEGITYTASEVAETKYPLQFQEVISGPPQAAAPIASDGLLDDEVKSGV